MPKLLLDEAPLVILPQLAVKIGLNEAIVLQQIHYWLQSAQTAKRANFFKKGHWWVCFSFPEWATQFPFWSEKTVKRTFSILESKGLIVGEQLSDNTWDRTNWYRVDYDQYERLVQGPDPGEETVREAGADASGQIDPMHRDIMTRSIGTDRPDASGQVDPIDRDRMTLSLEEETRRRLPKEKTTRTTADAQVIPSLFDDSQPADVVVAEQADKDLVEALVDAGVGRAAAQRLASEFADEARRQLEFLPHVPDFKTSRGAYLRKAIEEGFGPPPGWEAAQAKKERQATLERQKSAQNGRTAEEAARRNRLKELKQTVRETDPKAWEELVSKANQLLPPPVRNRPDGPIYQAAIESKIEELLAGMYPG
jgi:hypothetical protein